jgi:uncharacterized protein (TIGR03067 family)
MKWLALTVFTCALVGVGQLPLFASDTASDRDALQGSWRLVTRENGGQSRNDESMRLVFKGDRFQMFKEGDLKFEGTFKVDAAAKPRGIDMHVEKATEDTHVEKKTSLGIYEVSGDEFRWCADEPGLENRPTEFSGKGSGHMLAVFKREKAEAK